MRPGLLSLALFAVTTLAVPACGASAGVPRSDSGGLLFTSHIAAVWWDSIANRADQRCKLIGNSLAIYISQNEIL